MSVRAQPRVEERPDGVARLPNDSRGDAVEPAPATPTPAVLAATYILPIRRDVLMPDGELRELSEYLSLLAGHVEVIVVDASPEPVFSRHHHAWQRIARHIRPELMTLNGKVGNVITGVRTARHDRLIIADDDVRYSLPELAIAVRELDQADVVRPQNYFEPLPWHARWDTARSLLNRIAGGDWPGTLVVRRSILLATGGYDGEVLFENLELVRTVKAAGGHERVPLDLFVRRLPPDSSHFWSQRTRQAYDEFARPARLGIWLSVLPTLLMLVLNGKWRAIALGLTGIVGLAEAGRQRAGGARVFPMSASVFAPAWVLERSVCSWLAVGMRIIHGGVPYRGRVIRRAATPVGKLERKHRRSHVSRVLRESSSGATGVERGSAHAG